MYTGSSILNGGGSVWLVTLLVCGAMFLGIHSGSGDTLSRAVKCGCYDREAIRRGQFWRLVTVGFTHIQPWHLAMNLYALYNLSALERLFGHVWFAVILFGSVLGGSLLEYFISDTRYSVGLSGGLYGLMASYFLLLLRFGGVRSLRSMAVTLLMNLAINFMPGIAWQAHIGGALTGLVLTQIFLMVR